MYPALTTNRFRCPIQWLVMMAVCLLGSGCATPGDERVSPDAAAQMEREPFEEERSPELDAEDLHQLDWQGVPDQEIHAFGQPVPFERGGVVRPGLFLSVTVRVAGREEFSEGFRQVTEGGTLDLPLIGKVDVAGLRLIEVNALLTERYRAYLVDPHVVVEFAQPDDSRISPWGFVTVLGRVRNPGQIPLPPTHDLTVSAAIQQAGGLLASARDSSIRVTRREEDGTVSRIYVNLRAHARGQSDEDAVLRAGDVVFVPESFW